MKFAFTVCYASLLIPSWLHAQPAASKPDPLLYDLTAFARHKVVELTPELKKYDKNGNCHLEPEEAAAMVKEINDQAAKQVSQEVDTIRLSAPREDIDLETSHTLEEWAPMMPPPEPTATPQPKHFRLRASVDDFAIEAEDISKLNPAVFSYARDFITSSNTWTAKGAVGGYWEEPWANISAGFDFERVATDAPGESDVDSLTFRALLNHLDPLPKGVPLKRYLHTVAWSFGPSYATNFDFEGGLLGGTGEMELLWNNRSFRTAAEFWKDGLAVNLRHFIHMEGGGTLDDFPGKPNADDDYLRIGSRLEASIWPSGYSLNPRLKFRVGYGYYEEVLGDGPDYHNFYAGADFQLDGAGHFVLTLEYNNGLVPMLLTERDMLILSLGVRF